MRRAAVVVAGAITSALACAAYSRVEPFGFALGWVALVPWLAATDRCRSLRGALLSGVAMSIAFSLAVFAWLGDGIAAYTGAPPFAAYALLALLGPLLEPQLVATAGMRHWLRAAARSAGGPLRAGDELRVASGGALAYVAAEWIWPKALGDSLGHGFLASPRLRQGADLAGADGLVLVLVLANGCILAALAAARARRWRAAIATLACPLALAAALSLYGEVRLRSLRAASAAADPSHRLTAALVQGDVGSYGALAAELGTHDAVRAVLDGYFALSAEAVESASPDLLVWPETVYPTTFGAPKSESGEAFDREIAGFAAAARIPLVFGAYDVVDGVEYNAALFLAPSPAAAHRLELDAYRKRALFPLTEAVPGILDREPVRRALPWLGTWTPGDGPPVVALRLADGRAIRVAPLICYDAVDPALAAEAARQGAQLIVTLSNDAWFSTGQGPLQHLAVAAFRSIETRRPQLRATTTGISAIVDDTGEVVASAGVHERAAIVGTVALGDGTGPRTLAVAWGRWLGPAALIACVGLVGAEQRRRHRVRPAPLPGAERPAA